MTAAAAFLTIFALLFVLTIAYCFYATRIEQ